MLKKIGCEHCIDAAIGDLPQIVGGAFDKLYIGMQMRARIRIYIDSQFLPTANMIDEFTVTASEVEDGAFRINQIIKKLLAQDIPDSVSLIQADFRKAQGIQLLDGSHRRLET